MSETTNQEPASRPVAARRAKRLTKWGVIALLAAVTAVGGYVYYSYRVRYPTTSDAYVKADAVRVAAQVGGRVAAVLVSDQQHVVKDQLLFRIDPRSFDYRVRQAQASLALARQAVAADQAAVEAAAADVADSRAKLENARIHYRRERDLVARHMAPQSELDDAQATLNSARADLQLSGAKLHQAQVTMGTAGEDNQRIRQAQAALAQVQLDLTHTQVNAPCAGRVSGVKLQPGDSVAPGEPQFALICNAHFWIYANYKETDLTRIRPGQVATIQADSYPNHAFHGIVESIAPASGAAFSLLPPENATGNWVKVTQRIPVRILVVDASPEYPLGVQTSTEVTVDTGPGARPAGRARGDALTDKEALALARQEDLLTTTDRRQPGAGSAHRGASATDPTGHQR